ncbi:MAG: rRNA maturation RNase YbeY [Hyphomicrobiaceae bacterium]
MTHNSQSVSGPSVATAQDLDAENADADPRPLIVDVVPDDADWSAFDDAEAAVAGAADAVGARSGLNIGRAEATIALSSDAEVATLNGTYRGKPKPTNVLSFPASPAPAGMPEPGRRFLGDIIIARETVLAEAAEQQIPAVNHLQHLVVHGLLHLLGYDHENDDEAHIMEALETSILAGLGIPDPYSLA